MVFGKFRKGKVMNSVFGKKIVFWYFIGSFRLTAIKLGPSVSRNTIKLGFWNIKLARFWLLLNSVNCHLSVTNIDPFGVFLNRFYPYLCLSFCLISYLILPALLHICAAPRKTILLLTPISSHKASNTWKVVRFFPCRLRHGRSPLPVGGGTCP